MSPWIQQLLFTVVPALTVDVLLREAIEGIFFRSITAAVLAGAVCTAMSLLMGHADPYLSRGVPVSFATGFIVAILAGWAGKLRESP
ncbi:hypothetical protein [Luteolibacter luteus]|uniref:Uncharacterized protein n=1 Tax=Luteolibacter luteus TaxID=2728835 RepID=A0A858RFW8_9BACT|nr:hypothetical protein [Luteolibacter luteus]QJE95329.1 hypothetical protein HHL09_05895 [Luteolibacter luteus]